MPSTPRLATGPQSDVIRVPRSVGLTALRILGNRSGAVIEDPVALALYWLVPRGHAAEWEVTNTRALGPGTIPMPPRRRTQGPGPHWKICPGAGRWTTDPAALRAAIEDALNPSLGAVRA